MLTRRVVACLDVTDGRVVKGVGFQSLREVGSPALLAARYEAEGADELVFLDVSAGVRSREAALDVLRELAEQSFIPLTLGGGVRTVADADAALRAGADKVSINTAAVVCPELLTECAERFGAQCVVASIDAVRAAGRWRVRTRSGTTDSPLDAVEWAAECARRGAGEIMITSIDRDGTRTGYDLDLVRAVSAAVNVPVIASGGAGSAAHVRQVFTDTGASAALVAGILHDGTTTVGAIKAEMACAGLPVRRAGTPDEYGTGGRGDSTMTGSGRGTAR